MNKEIQIGYKLKLSKISLKKEKMFFEKYFKMYRFCELALDMKINCNLKLTCFFEHLSTECSNNFSIHLPKNALYSELEFVKAIQFINIIKVHKCRHINFIVHYNMNNTSDTYERIKTLLNNLPSDCKLLLENVVMHDNNSLYLTSLSDFIYEFSNNKLGICLDIGHLFYGCLLEGIDDKAATRFVTNKIKSNVHEIHIHDYDLTKDHKTLESGVLNFERATDIIDGTQTSIIIIETTVKDDITDGIGQINYINSMRKILYGNHSSI